MGFEASWNEDEFGEPSAAESPLLRAKSTPGEAIEAYDEDGGGAYASLSSLGAPKKKKQMVLTVDPEELEKAHNAIHMGAAQQLEIEELAGGELPPRMPPPMLGLSAMGAEDGDEEDLDLGDEAEDDSAALAPLPGISAFDDEDDESPPPVSRVSGSLDHLLHPAFEQARDDDEAFIPSIEEQLRNMRKRPDAFPTSEVDQTREPSEPPAFDSRPFEPPLHEPRPEPFADVPESGFGSWNEQDSTGLDAQDEEFSADLPPFVERALDWPEHEESESAHDPADDDDVTIPWIMRDELSPPSAAPEPQNPSAVEPVAETAPEPWQAVEDTPEPVTTVEAAVTPPAEGYLPDAAGEATGEPMRVELELGDASAGEVYGPVTFHFEPAFEPEPQPPMDEFAFAPQREFHPEPAFEPERAEETVAAAMPDWDEADEETAPSDVLDLAADGPYGEHAEDYSEPVPQFQQGEHSQLRARLIGKAERSAPPEESSSLLTILWRWLVSLFRG